MTPTPSFLRLTRQLAVTLVAALAAATPAVRAQELQPVVPPELRGQISAERLGEHDANRIRTRFYNFGMVGDYPADPIGVDLSVFHSMEVPRGGGMNYGDGTTPFVLARVMQGNGRPAYIMETGYRERQGISPRSNRTMRFEPRPGYFEEDPAINKGRSVALSNDPRTWPQGSTPQDCWMDKVNDPDDPGWCGSWNGYFGKRPNADQESFSVMDDNYYDAWDFFPDRRDSTRRGLGLRVEVRGFQWANPQAQNVIFWHYDIVNESTTDYVDNIIFGLYMDSGVGGSAISCDGIAESDDDNAFYDRSLGMNLVYTWDKNGRGVDLSGNCGRTGYLGYAYLETPGNPFNNQDDDADGMIDESRDAGPGERLEGQGAIRAYFLAHYNVEQFTELFGPLEERPAYVAGIWYTGDEDMDWVADGADTGADGIYADDNTPPDTGENDGIPTAGEPNFDRTDINESDQIGLTGFKMNRIRPGAGNPNAEVENLVFFDDSREWPRRLYDQFTDPTPAARFDPPLAANYNIGFVFASGPFRLEAGKRERFSLALAYGADLTELSGNVRTVQQIYNANYQFATPPPAPTVQAFSGDGRVTLVWDNVAEKAVDPVSNRRDFEGYRIYRSTDPNFLDAQVVSNGRGTGPLGHGRPIAQFDLKNNIMGFSPETVEGVAYWLGEDTGITHSWTDSTVTNGQTYYYAVTAYDRGYDRLGFYPSENAISVSRTPRGGTILPPNVVEVRPNAPVPGFTAAAVDAASVAHTAGRGVADLDVRVLNSAEVPDGHTFRLEFQGSVDSVRAMTYSLTDVTTGKTLFSGGLDLEGQGTGPVAAGLLPVISTPRTVTVDTLDTRFVAGDTPMQLAVRYGASLPINRLRPGYPEDLLITFADTPLDTSLAAAGVPARPAKFRVTTVDSGQQLNFRFRDTNGDGTLSATGEYIEVVTYDPGSANPALPRATWRIEPKTGSPLDAPGAGDVFQLKLNLPLTSQDVYTFSVRGQRVDADAAAQAFAEEKPYVVPNPYVASASFEPERFAVSGRGLRRLEFRAIPAGAVVRIYTLRGELVQTLTHDGSNTGIVAWDLRSKDLLEVAPGLYIFHVDAGSLGEYVGKFAIIK